MALSTGVVLDASVQQRLVDHVRADGSLLLTGRLPQYDTEHRRCTVLADALGLTPGELIEGSSSYYPSLVGHGPAGFLPETRTGSFEEITGTAAEPVFTDVDGRRCAVTVELGQGRAVVVTAELPSHPALFTALVEWLGSSPGLRLRTSVPGVVVTTGASPAGARMLHVLNPTGYAATVRVHVGDPTGLLDRPLSVPPRTGRMLGLGLGLPGGGTIVSSNAEVTQVDEGGIRFSPGLGDRTESGCAPSAGSAPTPTSTPRVI